MKSAVSQHTFIYIGSSRTALQGCYTKQSGDNLDEISVLTCSLFTTLQSQCLQKCLKIRVHGTYYSFNGLRKNMVPPTRGSMPNQGPRSEYVHCNNNMLANLKRNASALFWYTQRHHSFKGRGLWLTIGGYCTQPPHSKSYGKQGHGPGAGAKELGW